MFFLHVSNRTEHLLRHLEEVLRVSDRSNLFAKEIFLIQSQGMERMISQYLADAFTSWCNFEFFLPLDFLNYINNLTGCRSVSQGYERQVMAWRLEELLRNTEGEHFALLSRYLESEQKGMKRFQLSHQLAHIFDQYQLMRPAMLKAWEEGCTTTGSSHEKWQMKLWQLLRAREQTPHRGALLQEAIEKLTSGQVVTDQLPERVYVFGLHTMPPLFLEYVKALSQHINVHLFLMTPCKQYWGDIENKRQLVKKRMRGNSLLENELSDMEGSHPLLASLGQQGRDFQKMLLENVEFQLEIEDYHNPLQEDSPCLLHRIQTDLLDAKPGKTGELNIKDDDSVYLVSCHSRLRELQVLKDYLLGILYNHPSIELRDIVVMAPDIQEYAPLVPAIFSDVQHSIADRNMERRNPMVATFMEFLDLIGGRFEASQVVDLLQKEVVYTQFGLVETDLQKLVNWVDGAGIRWGLSAEHRHGFGVPAFSEGSWQFGLERLLMGYATHAHEMVDTILPYSEIEGGASLALGGLCRFISILEKAQHEFSTDHTLCQWSELLMGYCDDLLGEHEERDLLELRSLIADLGTICGDYHGALVESQVIRSWIEQSSRERRSLSGFLRGQLTFCSMLPMRSIPFRVVCLLGLDDGLFPKNDRLPAFNLMGESLQLGDRSQRIDDRYQFLEALLAAREHFYLSFIGQSIYNNDPIPPSVAVTELLELIENGYGIQDKVVIHPLHPFSPKYFLESEERLFSYDSHSFKTASTLRDEEKKEYQWWTGRRNIELQEVSIQDLVAFFSHPQRYFIRECMSIHLGNGLEVIEDNEPFKIEGLEKYLVDELLVHEFLLERDPAFLLQRLHHEGRWPLGAMGDVLYSSKNKDIGEFVQQVHEVGCGAAVSDISIDFEVGKYRIYGTLTNVYEAGILMVRPTKLKGKDLLRGWLYHLLGQIQGAQSWQTMIVAEDTTRVFAHTHQGPDLEYLLDLYVAGCGRPSSLYVEPAMAYIKQMEMARAKISPLDKAESILRAGLKRGYEPELTLLLKGYESQPILGKEFENHCLDFIAPIWRLAHEK